MHIAIEGSIHSGDEPNYFAISGFGGDLALVYV